MFPIQIRSIALLITSIFTPLSSMVIPLLQNIFNNINISIIITFTFSNIFMIVLMPFIP